MSEDKTLPQPPNWLAMHNAAKPEALVAVGPDRSITWGELYLRSRDLARRLYAKGLRPGNQAAVMTYNMPWYYEISQALQWLDVGMVMVGYRMKPPEIEYIVGNSDSKVLFFLSDFAERILPYKERYENLMPGGFVCLGETALEGAGRYEDLYLDTPDVDLENLPSTDKVGDAMIYTSGTTGRPKGAARKTDFVKRPGVLEYVFATMDFLKYQPDEVHLICCPLYHSAPSYFGGLPFMMGGTLVLQPRWDPEEFLAMVDKYEVNSTHLVPTQVIQLLQLPDEVEEVLTEMAGIMDAAVVGKPDPHWGEEVAAFVVAEPGARVDEEAIKDYCGRQMANHKIPVWIEFVDEIPRTPTGKILKRELRERL